MRSPFKSSLSLGLLSAFALLAVLTPSCVGKNTMDREESNVALLSTTTFEAESLTRTASAVGAGVVTGDAQSSNGGYVQFSGTPAVGAWIEFTLPKLAAATYSFTMYFKANNNRAINQASLDGSSLGSSCDEYKSATAWQVPCSLGSRALAAGDHKLRFMVTGKNTASAGYSMTIDKIVLTWNTGGSGGAGGGGQTGAGGVVGTGGSGTGGATSAGGTTAMGGTTGAGGAGTTPMVYEAESLARAASFVGSSVANDAAASGGAYVQLAGTPAVNDWLELTIPALAANTYDVAIYFKSNTNRGINKASLDGVAFGSTCDEYRATAQNGLSCAFGKTAVAAGSHKLRFTVTGKSSASSGYGMTIDKIVFSPLGGGAGGAGGGDTTTWPNATSFANSDPWLPLHHAQIKTVQPRVLVLNYANPGNPATVTALVNQIIAGFAEGSKPQGWLNESQPSQLQFQIVGGAIKDLRDGVNGRPPAPAGYPYENSTLWPRRSTPNPWGFDYAVLFSQAYAPNLGITDPSNPSVYLDLCTAITRGLVHEVWVVGSQDVPDVSTAEIVGMMQNYDANGVAIPGSYNRSAGNGTMNSDVPWCGHSIRVGFVNYTRGPGCYMHSYGHGVEGIVRTNAVPHMRRWFLDFADFSLDTKYSLPFTDYYGAPMPIALASNSATHTTAATFNISPPKTVNPFDPVCGNVHFSPNGTNHYDYGGSGSGLEPGVYTSCLGFGRHAGPGGADATSFVDASLWQKYASYGDCGGEFLTWWYQNMPQYGSGQTYPDATTMLSVWPTLYY